MIKEHQKFRMMDKAKKHEFFMEVNWNPDDLNTNESKVIKVTFPNGDESFLDRKHLNELLFAIGTAEDQRKLIPTIETTVKWYETVLSVKANKDIHKGEQITFPVKISIPESTEEAIGVRDKSKLIIPT